MTSQTCKTCDGDGSHPCVSCGGSGKHGAARCHLCAGAKTITCSVCDGTGDVDPDNFAIPPEVKHDPKTLIRGARMVPRPGSLTNV